MYRRTDIKKHRQTYRQKNKIHLETSCIPLVKKQIFKTELVCPSSVLTHVKSDRAQILMVESADEVAKHWSTGENLTHQIPFLWPRKVPRSEPLDIIQIYKTSTKLQVKTHHATQQYDTLRYNLIHCVLIFYHRFT